MILAATNWAAIGTVGTLIVAIITTIFGYLQARKADRSASTTKTIELGVTELIDQYRQTLAETDARAHNCEKKCEELAERNELLEQELIEMQTQLDNHEAQIIRLQNELERARAGG